MLNTIKISIPTPLRLNYFTFLSHKIGNISNITGTSIFDDQRDFGLIGSKMTASVAHTKPLGTKSNRKYAYFLLSEPY